ncbi:MAG: single-stranded DNA-binding protein [Chloroflexi bacterium]|nr:single-stranded DNA-binding protein [Chloroflexota bacterium]
MFQVIVLAGYVVSDPVMHYRPDGIAVTNFRMVTQYTAQAGMQRTMRHNYFDVQCLDREAQVCYEHLRRNDLVVVLGVLKGNVLPRRSSEGETSPVFQVLAKQVIFLKQLQRARPTEDSEAAIPETDEYVAMDTAEDR